MEAPAARSPEAGRGEPWPARALSLAARGWREFLDLARKVYEKAGEDDIFFMAGAIAFNVIVAIVPLALASIGIAGFLLRERFGDPAVVLRDLILSGLPSTPELAEFVESTLRGLLEQSAGFLSLGTIFLVWFATRLIGTLRTALREIFDLAQDRGIIAGKLFDIRMVLATGALFAVNVGITVGVDVVSHVRLTLLGYELSEPGFVQRFTGEALAFLSVWVMFLLIYRYLPARRTGWHTSLVAASFTAIIFEVMKQVFSLYATRWADYKSTYGGLATLVVLVVWIYYSAVVFILGGEVAQAVAMKRIRRRQKERLG